MDDRYRLLDHWRGLACLSVLFFHASCHQPDTGNIVQELVARLWIGVPIFFVLSGYCITASVHRTRDRGLPLRDYFRRRLRRIFPPYWAALLLVAGLSALLASAGLTGVFSHAYDGFAPIPHPSELGGWQWLGSATLTEGWRTHVLSTGDNRWSLGHAWTLGYEEQFYVVAGLLLWLAPRRWFAAAAITSLAVVAIVATVPHDPIGGFWFSGRWLTFAFGIGVYYQLHHASPRTRALVPLALLAALVWAVSRDAFGAEGIVTETGVGAAVALMLIPLYRFDLSLSGQRAMQPLAWCGRRCYSLYLLHWPVAKAAWWCAAAAGIAGSWAAVLMTVPLTLACSLACTAIFFEYVERPCLSRSTSPYRSPAAAYDPTASRHWNPEYRRPVPTAGPETSRLST